MMLQANINGEKLEILTRLYNSSHQVEYIEFANTNRNLLSSVIELVEDGLVAKIKKESEREPNEIVDFYGLSLKGKRYMNNIITIARIIK